MPSQKWPACRQAGFAHVILLLAVVLIVLAVLVYTGVIKLPSSIPFLSRGPKVELETKYENPFKKETQYVNPFDQYKNPFTVNR